MVRFENAQVLPWTPGLRPLLPRTPNLRPNFRILRTGLERMRLDLNTRRTARRTTRRLRMNRLPAVLRARKRILDNQTIGRDTTSTFEFKFEN